MRKYLYISICALLQLLLKAQQDPQYSQYMFNQVILNPAYIGSKDALNATAMFRKQWVNFNGAPQTTNISLSGPLKQKSLGLGGHLVQEVIGPKSWLSAYLDYAYRVRLGKGRLSLGLSTGLVNYNFNLSKLNMQDNSEPLMAYNAGNITRFDMNAGLYYYTSTFYAGISAAHLNSPKLFDVTGTGDKSKTVFYSLDPHVFITAGKAFQLSEDLVFNPSALIRITRGSPVDADLNLNFLLKNKLWLGASFRTSNTVVLLAQFRVSEQFKVGYSYDQGVRGVVRSIGGSHEIMLGYTFGNYKSKTVSTRYL